MSDHIVIQIRGMKRIERIGHGEIFKDVHGDIVKGILIKTHDVILIEIGEPYILKCCFLVPCCGLAVTPEASDEL